MANKNTNHQELTIAYYNHCFGVPAKQLWKNTFVHLWHVLQQPQKMEKMSVIKNTIKTIQSVKPDIFVISEVLGKKQRKKLESEFSNLGYTHFEKAQGHGWNLHDEKVEIVIGSKLPLGPVTEHKYKSFNIWGCGGGLGYVYAKDLDCYILFGHFAHPDKLHTKRVFDEQMSFVKDFLKTALSKNSKYLLLGDFNEVLEKLPSFLQKETYLSCLKETCSTTPLLKNFYHKNIDHMFGKGFKLIHTDNIVGKSDHTLIASKLKVL